MNLSGEDKRLLEELCGQLGTVKCCLQEVLVSTLS